jgi:hypothetical protein
MATKLPSKSSELVQAAIKGTVSAIPVVGGLIAELGACLISPVDNRKREWAEEVDSVLQVLKSQYQKPPVTLAEDAAFVTALLKATSTALATHRKEKWKVLREFLIGVGSRAIPDEELQHAILRLLDDLSVGHLEVLRFLDADCGTIKEKNQLEAIYGRYHYQHKGDLNRITFRWILADLSSRMVIHLGDVKDMTEFSSQIDNIVAEDSKFRPLQITDLGRQLLKLLRNKESAA